MLIMPGSYRGEGRYARPFCDLPSQTALVTRPEGPKAKRPYLRRRCPGQEFALLPRQKYWPFSPCHTIFAVVLVGAKFTELGQQILEMRGHLPLRQNVNNNARN
jgi:hypothetical protein